MLIVKRKTYFGRRRVAAGEANMGKVLYFLIITIIFCFSCSTVKPYQRIYLNDTEMQMGKKTIQKFEENVHAYREGATGGGSGKPSGWCGCN